MPVVAAGELDDELASGEAARQADGGHRRLGPGRDEAEPLDGSATHDLLGQLDLGSGGRAVRRAAGDRLRDGGEDLGVGVPEQHRPPAADEVDVLVAVGVGEVGAAGALDEAGCAADCVERADRELTPPGVTARARSNRAADAVVVGGGGSPGHSPRASQARRTQPPAHAVWDSSTARLLPASMERVPIVWTMTHTGR